MPFWVISHCRARSRPATCRRRLPASRSAGRLTLSVLEQGPRDGVPVVLLHGLSDSWWSWSEVLPHLPSTWRVLAPSQRGHGDSESPPAGSAYAIEEMARDVLALLDVRGIDRAVVVGHSMGGTVAERVAVIAPSGCVVWSWSAPRRRGPGIRVSRNCRARWRR